MNAQARLTLPPKELVSARDEAKAVLERAKAQVGFIPNMYKVMANLPALLETYLDGYSRFRVESGFTPTEQEVVFLTISRGNGCDYCMAAHSMIGEMVSKVPTEVLQALRNGVIIPDPKLAALSTFTERMRESRGLPTQSDLMAFLDAGYEERHVLAIILALSVKTLSNYSNHVFHTRLDDRFAGYDWRRAV